MWIFITLIAFFTFCCSIPLKQWKCDLEQAEELCLYSDCLQNIVAIFAGSQFFSQFQAYTSVWRDTSTTETVSNVGTVRGTCTGDKTGPVSGQVTSCNSNRDSQHSVSDCCTPHHSSASLPPYLTDNATDDDVMLTEAVTSNKDTLVGSKSKQGTLKLRKSANWRNRACQKSTSKEKPASSWQESRNLRPSLSESKVDETLKTGNSNSAGLHIFVLSAD